MPIFINWFETDVSAPVQKLFKRDFESWDESQVFHDQADLPSERFCRFEILERERRIARTVLFGKLEAVPEKFEPCEIDLLRERKVTERVIEFNLGQYLAARGMHVRYGHFGVTATQPAFRVNEIGLCAEAGIEFKSYYLHYRRQHGITLDWRVRQFFDQSLEAFPNRMSGAFLGMPVLLKSEGEWNGAAELAEYAGRYLGVVTRLEGDSAEVLCRDGTKRSLPKKSLLPEAKPDVVASLGALTQEQRGNDSIQRRMMTLSKSLTATGRRNVKILQDKLRAAIDFLSPDNRPAVTIDFVPYCAGKMKISTAPATAKVEHEQYV